MLGIAGQVFNSVCICVMRITYRILCRYYASYERWWMEVGSHFWMFHINVDCSWSSFLQCVYLCNLYYLCISCRYYAYYIDGLLPSSLLCKLAPSLWRLPCVLFAVVPIAEPASLKTSSSADPRFHLPFKFGSWPQKYCGSPPRGVWLRLTLFRYCSLTIQTFG